jgi:hypothetical protein
MAAASGKNHLPLHQSFLSSSSSSHLPTGILSVTTDSETPVSAKSLAVILNGILSAMPQDQLYIADHHIYSFPNQ